MIDSADDAASSRAIEVVAPSPGASGVSIMITRRQRAALADLGVPEDVIRTMTPAEAHARLGLTNQS